VHETIRVDDDDPGRPGRALGLSAGLGHDVAGQDTVRILLAPEE
jgi:hypothetical protein